MPSIDWDQLEEYLTCPKKYQFRFENKIQVRPSRGADAKYLAYRFLLKEWLKSRDQDLCTPVKTNELEVLVDQSLVLAKAYTGAICSLSSSILVGEVAVGIKNLQSFLLERKYRGVTTYQREVEGCWLSGTADFVLEEDDGVSVWLCRTSLRPRPGGNTQLQYLLGLVNSTPCRGGYFWVRTGDVRFITHEKAMASGFWGTIPQVLAAWSLGNREATPASGVCSQCEFQQACDNRYRKPPLEDTGVNFGILL